MRSLLVLARGGALLACLAFVSSAWSATPSSGTLTDSSGPQTYTAGPFFVANPTPVPVVDNGPECGGLVPSAAQPCDSYALTIAISPSYIAAHPNDKVKISIAWQDAGAGASDYDLYVYRGTVNTTNGTQSADYQSASSANPEVVYIPVGDANGTYTIKIVPYTPTGETVNATIELVAGAAGGSNPPPATAPGLPRYQVLAPPPGVGQFSQGEFNIGFNPKTGNIMTLSDTTVYRVTPPEKLSPALPQAGPSQWTDVTPSFANTTTLDPILITDQATGRTFESNQTAGANILFAFSDDDGANWTQVSASPPNGGVDHETLGAGPYPAGSPFAQIAQAAGYPNAVYYCSQGEFPAFCQRSDDGGLSFGPGVPIYNGFTTQCRGLHGHVRVAPDGTVYVPNARCGAQQGGAVSTDAGVTWNEFLIPQSSAGNSDPSVAVASDSTAYFCYVAGDGHPHVAVSHDDGKSWADDVDIGAQQGIQNAVFPEAVAGDPDRAACGFIGTTTQGNYQSLDFKGIWYLFIAHTYDGGKTWTTVNATPNDPVQGAGGICQQGINCNSSPNNRNLLDFNEVTMDDHGRVLYGFDKGCVGSCIQDPTNNSFVAAMRVARQSGGKTLLAKYDPTEPTTPRRPYLSGTRTQAQADLSWNAPDDGGSAITNYKIYRGTASGGESLIGQTGDAKTAFIDRSADPSVSDYYYYVVAVNGVGDSRPSNEIKLAVSQPQAQESPCVLPGVTVATDPTGDETDGLPQHDVKSVQIAEPYDAANPPGNKLVFTLNLSSASNIPPNTVYYVRFNLPDKTQYFVSYDTSTVPASFNYGHVSTGAGGVSQDNTDGALDPSSGVDTANNRIVFVLPKSDIAALANNAKLTTVTGEVRVLIGALGTGLISQVDATNTTGDYQQVGNASCAPNHPPMASLTANPTMGPAPLTVSFDGSGSSDPDAGDSVASYTFNFGDGSQPVTQSAPTISHTYQNVGNYDASLTVTDTHGAASQNAASVVIQATNPSSGGTAPMASLAATPASGTAPLAVAFDASGSKAGSGSSIASYTFNFGDGSAAVTQSGATISHSYAQAGSYSASVVVTDADGQTASAAVSIQVQGSGGGSPPEASLAVSPSGGEAPLTVAFDASGSHNPDGAKIVAYRFDFNDGSAPVTQSSAKISHVYDAAGTYHPSVVVQDSDGASSAPAVVTVDVTTHVTVTPGGPVAELVVTPTSGPAPLKVTFDGSKSYDPNGTITGYTFDFGDGSQPVTQTTPTATHTYTQPGRYTPSLTVTDSQNATSRAAATVSVSGAGGAVPSSGSGGGALDLGTLLALLGVAGLRGLVTRRKLR